MSQYDFGIIDPAETNGTELAAILGTWRSALISQHKGSDRPSYAQAGTLWLKEITGTSMALLIFDGENDVLIGTLNVATGYFTPSFGSLAGIIRADGSGGVAAATAAQIVALIGTAAVANASHAETADSAGTASSAGTAANIADGAVATAAKIAANIITLNKLARGGVAGQVVTSGGPNADPVWAAPTAAVSSVNAKTGAVTLSASDVGAAAASHSHAYADLTAIVACTQTNDQSRYYMRFTRANGATFDIWTGANVAA